MGETAPPSEGLSHISKLLSQLCPESVPSSVASDSHACQFKGLFSNLAKPPEEPFTPVLFHRISELLAQSRAKFVASVTAGKATVFALPFTKRLLAVSSDPEFGRAAVANPVLPRIIGNLPSSRSAGVQFFELAHLESVARQALQSQSVVFWLFNAVLNWLKEESFVPSDPVLFEELVQAFSLAMVSSTSSSSSLGTFCQAKRREAVLSHFPARIGPHFWAHLASSSFEGPYLFNDESLSQVLTASREDSAVSANIALTKAASFPVFGAGKSDRKASSDRSSNASSSSAPSWGRGRGSVAERFRRSSNSSSSSPSASQEKKRKSESSSGRSAKSPRRSVNSNRSRGFHR